MNAGGECERRVRVPKPMQRDGRPLGLLDEHGEDLRDPLRSPSGSILPREHQTRVRPGGPHSKRSSRCRRRQALSTDTVCGSRVTER